METFEKIDILLVDDRPDNFTVLEAVLDSPLYNLVSATSGFKAISLAAQTEFAVILLDVQMPGKDGFETAKEIRQQGASKDTPIIFVTAIYGDEAYVNVGYDAGAVDYIFKPFNPHVLRSKVSVLVDLYVKTRKLFQQSELLRDIEKREHANKLLEFKIQSIHREHELQQKYKDLVESIDHCIVWSADPENLKFSFVSPQAEDLIGYKTSEFSDQADFWSKHVHSGDLEIVLNSLQKAQKGQDAEFEHRFITKEGRILWFHTSVHLSNLSETGSRELRGLSIDITSLKNAELVLKESEETQRFLSEIGIALATSALDYYKILSKISTLLIPRFGSWCAIHMAGENKQMKMEVISCETPEKIELVREFENFYHSTSGRNLEKAELMNIEEKDFERLKISRDLALKSYMSVPIFSRNRNLGIITLASTKRNYRKSDLDIVIELARRAALAIENALLYKKAEDAIQTRDEFLSIASHELRTPLTPLKIQFQMITKLIDEGRFQELTPEKLKKMMARTDQQLDRLNNLIEELLNVSRINLGRITLERKNLNLSDLVKTITEQYKEQLSSSSCELSLDLDPSLTGEWDPEKLEQVIVNLLTNSIKYGQGKPICIRTSGSKDGVQLSVQDFGIGIDPEAQGKIFNLFERATSAKKYGGMGLGLYVVRNLVEQHGGTIGVESRLGVGSTFTMKLPKNIKTQITSNTQISKNLEETNRLTI